jgi:hypothetical protein
MFLAMLMSFELIQGLWGYHHSTAVSNLVINPIARMFGNDDLPKD